MRHLKLSGVWAQIPWRRRKEEPADSVSAKKRSNASLRENGQHTIRHTEDKHGVFVEAGASEPRRRASRIWKTEEIPDSSPMRSLSASYRRFMRPIDSSQQQTDAAEDEHTGTTSTKTCSTEQSLLQQLRRRSQIFSLPRSTSSSGALGRRSSLVVATGHGSGGMSVLSSHQDSPQRARPRHVPISIDYSGHLVEDDQHQHGQSLHDIGPSTATASNAAQDPDPSLSQRFRKRSIPLSKSFSHLRERASRALFSSTHLMGESISEKSSNEHEMITAPPSLDTGHTHRPSNKLSSTTQHLGEGYYAPVERRVVKRATPKMVDISAPRPVSMISASTAPRRRSRPGTATAASAVRRQQGMFAAAPVTVMNDEDGPKGDWARTRHSWLGTEGIGSASGPEQLEWEKLKQFIEAYSSGDRGDTGMVSIRKVEDSSGSSGSSSSSSSRTKDNNDNSNNHRVRSNNRFSNAQALAALEFGLS